MMGFRSAGFERLQVEIFAAAENAKGAMRQIAKDLGPEMQRRAREKLGIYQPPSHGFPGWPALSPETENPEGTPLYNQGDLSDSIQYYSSGNSAYLGTDLESGIAAENGTATEPPRPFLGPAAMEVTEENLPKMAEKVGKAIQGASVEYI